jgi:hypothetical protein
MQVSMQKPKHIHLSSPINGSRLICEVLESNDPISSVLPLLESHGLTAAISGQCPVICKDSAGITIATDMELGASLQHLEERLAATLVRMLCSKACPHSDTQQSRYCWGGCEENLDYKCRTGKVKTCFDVQGQKTATLVFQPAPDGCLHVIAGPNQQHHFGSSCKYQRSASPQPHLQV